MDALKIETLANLQEKLISLDNIHFHIKNDEINSIETLEAKLQDLQNITLENVDVLKSE